MAQTLHFVIAQAASRQDELGHESQIMRLELDFMLQVLGIKGT
jgi:hypothetical protein